MTRGLQKQLPERNYLATTRTKGAEGALINRGDIDDIFMSNTSVISVNRDK